MNVVEIRQVTGQTGADTDRVGFNRVIVNKFDVAAVYRRSAGIGFTIGNKIGNVLYIVSRELGRQIGSQLRLDFPGRINIVGAATRGNRIQCSFKSSKIAIGTDKCRR